MIPQPICCKICGKYLRTEMSQMGDPIIHDTHVHLEDCVITLVERVRALEREVLIHEGN